MARNVFGTSPSRLRNEYPFFDYRCESGDLMPVIDLEDMMSEDYSAVHSPVFLGTMAQSAGYSTPQSFIKAVGSHWYIPGSGPAGTLMMAQSSYEAAGGPRNIRQMTKTEQKAGYDNLVRDVRITDWVVTKP